MDSRALLRLAGAVCILAAPALSPAQWRTQDITLTPGWNSIFLEVQPSPADPETVFGGLPVDSAWAYSPRNSVLLSGVDPASLAADAPDWLSWFPAGSANEGATDLFRLRGGKAYLVNFGGAGPATLSVRGTPGRRKIEWQSNALNFVGFPLSTTTATTFANFFATSPAHAGQSIYRFDTSTRQFVLASPGDTIPRGQGFWIYTNGASDFEGPVSIASPVSTTLDFDSQLVETRVELTNPGASPKTVSLSVVDSETPPAGNPTNVATIPLSSYVIEVEGDPASRRVGFVPITGPLSVTIPAKGTATVPLAVRRADMPEPPAIAADPRYLGLLRIDDGAGFVRDLGLSAKWINRQDVVRRASRAGEVPSRVGRGLWVGTVSVREVSAPSDAVAFEDASTTPVAAPFSFRFIMHVDGNGQARLLGQIYQVFKAGFTTPNPDDPEDPFVTPGRYALVWDNALLPQFTGATLVDGEPVGIRQSSINFAFKQPVALLATETSGNIELRPGAPIQLGYDDPLNPFKHAYHPDHDNLNELFDTGNKLPEGIESFTIVRDVKFTIEPDDPDGLLGNQSYGDRLLGGTYQEIMTGVHKNAIKAKGVFRMKLVSDIEVLNDGL